MLSWNLFTNPLATIAALIAFLGMTMNNPFSVVTAHRRSPLASDRVPAATTSACCRATAPSSTARSCILYMNLFLGGATNIFEMVLKTFALYMMTVIVGVSFPRFRADQSIRFFLKIPAAIGVVAVILTAL
ncbi:MAG: NADH-quinone oxidoreductase subunit H [Halomonas sp.]|uniref:NADH-quinone oxidoreductase subunit H n=1 Tax=Halomonas sp. TaxID=1486246 RepID=UPI002ACE2EDD|nr:NADH-quinone oxidoreductase subunit H [Halomonas sp.]MDZ7852576.1 NADH-quinone oxidoreductase subunit H [Halomonas sp.]